jgi:predicted enzyme related to lactoylglutathione lyase
MGHPVNWFQISGKNGKKLEAFYKKVFAWKMNSMPGAPMALVDAEPGGIPGGVGASQDGTASVAVYVSVSDVVEHLKLITQAGGSPAMPPMDLPSGMGAIAGFLDPEGNWVGLWQPDPLRAGAKAAAPKAKKTAGKAASKAKTSGSKASSKTAATKKTVKKKAAPKGKKASKK